MNTEDTILIIRSIVAIFLAVGTIPVLFAAFSGDGWLILAFIMLIAAAIIAPPFLTALGVTMLGMFVLGFAFPRREPIKWKVMVVAFAMFFGGLSALMYFAPAAHAVPC